LTLNSSQERQTMENLTADLTPKTTDRAGHKPKVRPEQARPKRIGIFVEKVRTLEASAIPNLEVDQKDD